MVQDNMVNRSFTGSKNVLTIVPAKKNAFKIGQAIP